MVFCRLRVQLCNSLHPHDMLRSASETEKKSSSLKDDNAWHSTGTLAGSNSILTTQYRDQHLRPRALSRSCPQPGKEGNGSRSLTGDHGRARMPQPMGSERRVLAVVPLLMLTACRVTTDLGMVASYRSHEAKFLSK